MAKLHLTPAFLKDSIKLLRERGLKETLFGKNVALSIQEKELLSRIKNNEQKFFSEDGRRGQFLKIDLVHKGSGYVYLMPNRMGDASKESVVFFDEDVAIQPGPDLYLYLSTNVNIKNDGLGEYLDLGLIKGTKGGQAYIITQPIAALTHYKSVVIYCKQFSVLFTYAPL